MNDTRSPLDRALELHQSGQLGAAIAAYQAILAQQPANARLLYLLGTALLQAGDLDNGSAFLQRSLGIDGRNPAALNNLGIALKDLKRFDEALAAFDKSLALDPAQAEAHNNRGAILKELDRLDEALASFGQAIAAQPGYAQAHGNRGNALQTLRRFDEALAAYERALALRPDFRDAHSGRGHALRALQRHPEALESFDKALLLQPDRAEAHLDRGVTLRVLRRLDEALASLDRAIALAPRNAAMHADKGSVLVDLKRPEAAMACFDAAIALAPQSSGPWNDKGHTLFVLGRLDEARACFERAVALDPDNAGAHANLGAVLQRMGLVSEAMASHDRAIALDPAAADAPWNKAQLLILNGDYLEGWKLYESRLDKPDFATTYYRFPQPSWRGREPLEGRRIFVHSEQGAGDVIQFCRYLPLLERRGAEIVFEVPRALVSFVSTLACRMTTLAKGDPQPAFDVWCPLMSLPMAFETTTATIPAETPYLLANVAKVAAWRDRLGRTQRLRVGLVWSGSPTHANDMNRSMALATLAPLLGLPVEWHSLQKEVREQDARFLAAHPQVRTHHQALGDFADTAALAACMDLVITVDTGVAHLAGAIGRPVWILLPHAPDYRWMRERADSPWYPTARLFRQPRAGDWASVVDTVRASLSRMIEQVAID